MASQNVPSNFKDLIQKLVSVRHTDILLLICKQFLKELPAFWISLCNIVGGTEIIFLLKWKTARLLLSVIVVTIMAIPKILLIRWQLSLNYSVAQRKNLDINCKKTENKETSKRKTTKKKNRRLDGPYTDPLRRGRTLHPYRRRSCAVVFSSLDPAQEQRRSRYHHFSFGTLTSQYAHGKSQTLSCFLCIQELKYPI